MSNRAEITTDSVQALKIDIPQRGEVAQLFCRHRWLGGYATTQCKPDKIYFYPYTWTKWNHIICRKCGKSLVVRRAPESAVLGAVNLLESALDTFSEIGNGVSDEDMQAAVSKVFAARDLLIRPEAREVSILC